MSWTHKKTKYMLFTEDQPLSTAVSHRRGPSCVCHWYVSRFCTKIGVTFDLKMFPISVWQRIDTETPTLIWLTLDMYLCVKALALLSIMWVCVAHWEVHTVDSIRISGLIPPDTSQRPLLLSEDCVKASTKWHVMSFLCPGGRTVVWWNVFWQ